MGMCVCVCVRARACKLVVGGSQTPDSGTQDLLKSLTI